MSKVARPATRARRLIASLACVTCAVVLGAPGAALGQTTLAPPGNSGVDQYFETVPGAAGNRPAQPQANSGGAPAGSSTLAQLSKLGADGRKAAQLAAGTAPVAHPNPPAATPAGHATGSSPAVAGVGAVATGGGGGLGILLPLLLAAALLGVLAAVVVRRRRSKPE